MAESRDSTGNGGASARKLVLDQTVTVPKQSGINYT
jgi:hypothetical protein